MILNEGNNDIIERFFNFDWPKKDKIGSGNLYIEKENNGWSIINYSTPLAYVDNNYPKLIFINNQKYSVSTSKVQSKINLNLPQELDGFFCDGDSISKAIYGNIKELFNSINVLDLKRECISTVFNKNFNEYSLRKNVSLIGIVEKYS